jgi:hypothetical protein
MNPRKMLSILLFVVFALTALCTVALAQQGQHNNGYSLVTTIALPGGFVGGDIAWVDSANARLYLADRGNAAATPPVTSRIAVIDTLNNVYVNSVSLGAAPNGPNGVLAIPRTHEIWAGMNDSTVVVASTDDYTIKHVISTGGKGLTVTPAARADELAYDPEDHIILIANDRDTPPFITFIDAKSYTVLKTLNYDGILAPQSTGGLEQPVWNQATLKFYLAIPATKANPNGEVDEIDPLSYSVLRSFPTACMGPAGLVLIPNQRLVTSCGDIIDIASGNVVTTVPGVGGDEIWYSAGEQRVYFGGFNRISVPVVDATTTATGPLAMLTVGTTTTTPTQTTHQVAADDVNHEIFVPVANAGIQVWKGGSALTASPTSLVAAGGIAKTTLAWNAPGTTIVELHVGSPTGPLFASGGPRGSATTGTWVTDGMTFYLQDVTGGTASAAANTLATVVVHVASH